MTGDEKVSADLAFLEYILKAIVDFPEQVRVVRSIDELGVLLTVELAAADMGTVIGKNGQTANALRMLLRVIGAKTSAHINMKIVDKARPGVELDENSSTL